MKYISSLVNLSYGGTATDPRQQLSRGPMLELRPHFAFLLSTCRVWANQGLRPEGEIMDTLRVVFMGLAYFLWVVGGIFLVFSIASEGWTSKITALVLIVIGLIFFGLNKVTARR